MIATKARLILFLMTFGWPAVCAAATPAEPPVVVTTFKERTHIALLSDGRLMASYVGKTSEAYEATVRFSSDGGRTWTDPRSLLHLHEAQGVWSGGKILQTRDEDFHIFLRNDANTISQRRRLRKDIWHLRSKDGNSWEPKRIWEGHSASLQSLVQLKNGRILLPFSYVTKRNWANRGSGTDAFTFLGRFSSTVLYSDDGGDTFQQSSAELKAPAPDWHGLYGAVEPVVLELLDGRVWMLLRTQMGRLYESFSDDGITWSPARATRLLSSDSPAGLVRLDEKRIALFWNSCLRFPHAYGGQHVLHAAISEDEGATWRGIREALRDPLGAQADSVTGAHGSGSPLPTVTPEGNIVVASGYGESGASVVLIDPDWLYQTRQEDSFGEELDQWSVFGTKGVGLVAHPEKENARVLQIRKPDAAWPAAAVRNFPLGRVGHLSLRFSLIPGAQAFMVALTDHFSVPFDEQDRFHSLFNLFIGADHKLAGRRLQPNRWYTLVLDWDCRRRECRVLLDGVQITVLPLLKETLGVNYLRLRSRAPGTDPSGMLVESVKVDVSKSWP